LPLIAKAKEKRKKIPINLKIFFLAFSLPSASESQPFFSLGIYEVIVLI
jgi:hypothetical protein